MKRFALRAMAVVLFAAANGAQAADWSAHVPVGWKLVEEAADGPNAVLMIEEDNPAKWIKNDGLGADTLNTNPRKLLFLRKNAGGYAKLGSADTFLPSAGSTDTPCLVDPLEEGGISLAKGVLAISMHYWLSCGSYGVTKTTYKFRLEGNRYRLIGLDNLEFSRASGLGRETSINFLTARKIEKIDVQIIEAEEGAKAAKPKTIKSGISKRAYYLDAMNPEDCNRGNCAHSWCLSS